MDFKNMRGLTLALTETFSKCVPLTELPPIDGAPARYPKLLPFMRFEPRRYAAEGFGNVFTMYTHAMGGMMQLATLVFTPNAGGDAPLLLIDVMAMAKKRAAFVEYYDLTERGARCPALEALAAKHAHLPDYPEKDAWYVSRRAPFSLIKGGEDEGALLAMLEESVWAYAAACAQCTSRSDKKLARLADFVDEMVEKGNPSSSVLEKALGKEGAQEYFRRAIMPACYTTE